MKIVADDKIPFLRGVFEPFAEVVYLKSSDMTPETVSDADALIVRTRTRCNAELLRGSRVKFIASATIGFDHINAAELDELGIIWRSAPGCNAASVAQYLGAVLTGFGIPLEGKVLGVVGVGNVGKLAVKVGKALGMKLLLNDPPREEAEGSGEFVSLDEIAERADIVTLHVPKVSGGAHPTIGLIGEKFFASAKPGLCIINAARGEALDKEALKEALKSGKVSHAAVDVWKDEPDIDRELLTLCDFATPHIAGYSTDGKANGTGMAVRAVAEFFGIEELRDFCAVPPPPANEETIEVSGDGEEELHRILCHTFDLHQVDGDLKRDPASFEQLRAGAPLRREPFAYSIIGGSDELRRKASALGFKLG